jgi:predicted lipoprotein with Yx(FWY)xxD motif
MIRIAAVTTVLLLTATACSSSGGGSSTSSTTSPAANATTVRISVSHGELVGPNGHTLYSNSVDSATHLICTGQCLSIWPPVLGTPAAGTGVSASALGTIKRGGQVQATFDGHPLYEFAQDSAPGDAMGDGISDAGGTWHPVGTGAHQVGTQPAPSTGSVPATGTKSGGGGYGGYP